MPQCLARTNFSAFARLPSNTAGPVRLPPGAADCAAIQGACVPSLARWAAAFVSSARTSSVTLALAMLSHAQHCKEGRASSYGRFVHARVGFTRLGEYGDDCSPGRHTASRGYVVGLTSCRCGRYRTPGNLLAQRSLSGAHSQRVPAAFSWRLHGHRAVVRFPCMAASTAPGRARSPIHPARCRPAH